MSNQIKNGVAALLLCVLGLSAFNEGPALCDELVDKEREVLRSWIANAVETMSVKIEPRVTSIEDEFIQKSFPGHRFYGVYFPTWPRAVLPPKQAPYELSNSNVVSVRHEGSVEAISSEDALGNFLGRALADVEDEPAASAAVLASLRLAGAVAEGGPYQLERPDVTVVREKENIVASAVAAAHEPARGEVTIRMEFSADGTIMPNSIEIGGRLRPGPPS